MSNYAKAQVMRAIGEAEHKLPANWGGPFLWSQIVELCASLITDGKSILHPASEDMLLFIGAVAHREAKRVARERAEGEVCK